MNEESIRQFLKDVKYDLEFSVKKDENSIIEIEGFGKGIESLPPVIYKFRDWNNPFHKSTIIKQEIWSASASSFNDPFDSEINLNLSDKHIPQGIIKIRANESLKRLYPDLNRNQRKFILLDKDFRRNYEERIRIFLGGMIQKTKEHIQNKIGIISFTGERENILLWSHYADSHKGFSLGLDTKKYFECSLGYAPTYIFRLKYGEDYPIMELDISKSVAGIYEVLINALIYKSIHWEYEKEIRSFFPNRANFNVKYPKDALKEIVLGCQMPESSRKEIISIITSEFQDVKILQAEKAKDSFSLVFQKLN